MTNAFKKSILLLFGMICLVLVSRAQQVEDELGFKYVKAKYLMETERYEDAIKAFSAIVSSDPDFEDALLYRAEAKYKMAAYKGTKKDVLKHIDIHGVNEKALILLGKSDYKMENYDAALNTLLVASAVVINDGQVYEYIGNIYQEDGKLLKACKFWQEGAAMSSKCRSKARKVCGSTVPESPKNDDGLEKSKEQVILKTKKDDEKVIDMKGKSKEEDAEIDKKTKTKRIKITELEKNEEKIEKQREKAKSKIDEKESDDVVVKEKKSTPTQSSYEDTPPEDDTENEIVIDEDLSIYIYGNSLGKRKVLDKPNILILSETSGKVAVDICVNRRGKVESAELNAKLTTIEKQSLISLAIRKAKDFWFERGKYKEQCGVVIFDIKGS